jgi:hypothetical protein
MFVLMRQARGGFKPNAVNLWVFDIRFRKFLKFPKSNLLKIKESHLGNF